MAAPINSTSLSPKHLPRKKHKIRCRPGMLLAAPVTRTQHSLPDPFQRLLCPGSRIPQGSQGKALIFKTEVGKLTASGPGGGLFHLWESWIQQDGSATSHTVRRDAQPC